MRVRTTSSKCSAGLRKRFCGDREDAARLAGSVFVVRADRAGSGQVNGVPTRTAREKPMIGSYGDPPLMFCAHGDSGFGVSRFQVVGKIR